MRKLKPKRLKAAPNIAPINQTYGELIEDLFFTGFAFERGCHRMKNLLSDDSWKRCGEGFTDVDAFLATLRLEKFAKVTEERAEIARLIKQLRPEVSTRAIGRALKMPGIRAPKPEKAKEASEGVRESRAQKKSGAAAAKLVIRREEGAKLRRARVQEDEERILNLAPIVGKFRTLDPAWDYEWLSLAGRAKPGYAMQTHKQLMALDVKQWADEEAGCHLYLWVTNNFMARGCTLMEHWGFQHRTVLTWHKEGVFGQGSYFRNSTEHVLFGTLDGTLGKTTTRHAAAFIRTYFTQPRTGEHSEKPEEFYEIVRAASYPPYGEGNQRTERPDFTNLYCPVTEREETANHPRIVEVRS